jgi:hypothetical protein
LLVLYQRQQVSALALIVVVTLASGH